MRYLLVLLAACGSAAPPAPVVVHDPPLRPSTPAPISCADAGVILRGSVEKPKEAGPAKEAAIASACLTDQWSREILDCVGTQLDPNPCLDKLAPAQRTALNKKLKQWAESHTGESFEAEGEIAPPQLTCDSIGDVMAYSPALTVTGEERDFARGLRMHEIKSLCESGGWAEAIKLCFVTRGASTDDCRAKLEAGEQRRLADRLAEIDALVAKIAAYKKKPAPAYDCKTVVAVHYSDAAWKGQAELPKNPKATRAELATIAADRKKMIADSRAALLEACTRESWNATDRACLLAGGDEWCARAKGQDPRWGFPASSVVTRTGVSECDSYTAVTQKLMQCGKLPQSAKDAIWKSIEAQRLGWKQGLNDPTVRSTMAVGCTQAEQALRQAAASIGCTI